ncbi:survival motor neuron protein-like isoform X3 [Scylla paramamosain]|uniref:survival motor neuron protein-like isoform X3 n=1 Tax=Scylla paramamosain TaxID=85552 RepID=UPI003082EB65
MRKIRQLYWCLLSTILHVPHCLHCGSAFFFRGRKKYFNVLCDAVQHHCFTIRQDELTHEEIWDDTLLIQQYDEAMAKVTLKMAQRTSVANTTESEQSEASHRDVGGQGQQHGIHNTTSNSNRKKKKKSKKKHNMDQCSSVAESDQQSDTDCEKNSKRQRLPSDQYTPHNMMPPPNYPSGGLSTPPPHLPLLPPPPALALDTSGDPQTSEALHTMLMSWYMTGYHTGYYQGIQQTQARRKNR